MFLRCVVCIRLGAHPHTNQIMKEKSMKTTVGKMILVACVGGALGVAMAEEVSPEGTPEAVPRARRGRPDLLVRYGRQGSGVCAVTLHQRRADARERVDRRAHRRRLGDRQWVRASRRPARERLRLSGRRSERMRVSGDRLRSGRLRAAQRVQQRKVRAFVRRHRAQGLAPAVQPQLRRQRELRHPAE